jgi:putative NADPH-quinone reductase
LRSKADWDKALPPAVIAEAQRTLAWAEHLVIIYPLWLGGMPALLKGFLEQALRPAFITGGAGAGTSWKTALKGRSSRIVITMGMPAFAYRWYFGAHSFKSLKRSILSLVGIGPNRHTLIGMIEGMSDAKRAAWLDAMRILGKRAR